MGIFSDDYLSSMCNFDNLKPEVFADSTLHFYVMSFDGVLFKSSIINKVGFAQIAFVRTNS